MLYARWNSVETKFLLMSFKFWLFPPTRNLFPLLVSCMNKSSFVPGHKLTNQVNKGLSALMTDTLVCYRDCKWGWINQCYRFGFYSAKEAEIPHSNVMLIPQQSIQFKTLMLLFNSLLTLGNRYAEYGINFPDKVVMLFLMLRAIGLSQQRIRFIGTSYKSF